MVIENNPGRKFSTARGARKPVAMCNLRLMFAIVNFKRKRSHSNELGQQRARIPDIPRGRAAFDRGQDRFQ